MCVCVSACVFKPTQTRVFQGVAFSGKQPQAPWPVCLVTVSWCHPKDSSSVAATQRACRGGLGQAQVLHITVLCLNKHMHAHTQVNINTRCMASRQRGRGGGSGRPAVGTHTVDIQNAEIWINMLVLYETHTHKYTCIHSGLTARVPMYQTLPGKASLSLAARTVPKSSPPKKHQLDIHQLQKPHNCNNHRLGG